MAVRPSDRPGPGRVLADSAAWRTVGARRKVEARRMGRCVECFVPLPSRRTIYCSASCRWRFHGRFFWDAARVVVLRRDRYTCRACRRRVRARELDVDHILEIARGGAPLDPTNLQTLCRPCHRRKTSEFLRSRARPLEDPAEWFPA